MLGRSHIVAEWRAYLSRSSRAAINEALNRFRRALASREILKIVQAYDLSLQSYLQPQEHQLLELAHKFIAASQSDNDAALVEVNEAIIKFS